MIKLSVFSILNEMGIYNNIQNIGSEKIRPNNFVKNDHKKISTLSNDFDLYHKQTKEIRGHNNSYVVAHPKTKEIHTGLLTFSGPEYKHETIINLKGKEKSESKAHDLYHHLIHHHDKILIAQDQSMKAFKVAQKLSQMDGIYIHKFHHENKITKVHNLHKDNIKDHHVPENYNILDQNLRKKASEALIYSKHKDVKKHL